MILNGVESICQFSLPSTMHIYELICIFTLSPYLVSGYRECTTLNSLQNFKLGYTYTNATSYLVYYDSSPVMCVETCMRSSVCKSVNFNTSSGECRLYHQPSREYNITEYTDFTFTDVDDWPIDLASDCFNHSCPNNTVCVPDTGKIYTCVTVGCLWASGLEDTLSSDQPMWEFGSTFGVECTGDYYTTEMAVCSSGGRWVIPTCRLHATNCKKIKNCNQSYSDGEYWIYRSDVPSKTKLFKIYCHNMTSTKPEEYVTLFHDNFSTRSPYKYDSRENCSLVKWDDDLIVSRKMGRTFFSKVGLKIHLMYLNEGRYHFANSTTSYTTPYAAGYSCGDSMNSTCPALGRFLVDLRNTSFLVSPATTWSKDASKNTYIQNITFSHDNQIVEGRCGGHCGGCTADDLILEINENFQPDFNSAVYPVCD